MWKIQELYISSDLCIRLTWNLTGSYGQQQWLRGWSRMVVKQFQDGGRPPFWKSISPYLSEKSSDFYEILYTAANIVDEGLTASYFELDEHHVIKNEKVALDRLRVQQNVLLVFMEIVSRQDAAIRLLQSSRGTFGRAYDVFGVMSGGPISSADICRLDRTKPWALMASHRCCWLKHKNWSLLPIVLAV